LAINFSCGDRRRWLAFRTAGTRYPTLASSAAFAPLTFRTAFGFVAPRLSGVEGALDLDQNV
jgi:hypothetical protein